MGYFLHGDVGCLVYHCILLTSCRMNDFLCWRGTPVIKRGIGPTWNRENAMKRNICSIYIHLAIYFSVYIFIYFSVYLSRSVSFSLHHFTPHLSLPSHSLTTLLQLSFPLAGSFAINRNLSNPQTIARTFLSQTLLHEQAFVYHSIYLSFSWSIYRFFSLSIYICVSIYVYLSSYVYLCISISVCPSTYQFMSLSQYGHMHVWMHIYLREWHWRIYFESKEMKRPTAASPRVNGWMNVTVGGRCSLPGAWAARLKVCSR